MCCLAVTAIAYSFGAFINARPLGGQFAAVLNPSGPPPSAARLDLEEDVLALQSRLLYTAARVQQLLYERARPLPISGRMPAVLLASCLYDCPGGKWVAVVKLKDLWEALDGLLADSSFIVRDIRYQQRQLQQEEVLPDEVVQALMKRNNELCNSYDAPSRQVVHHLSVFAAGDAARHARLQPTGVKWREQVPDFLDTALDLCGQLQAYAAELAALVPRSYVCNNLKVRGAVALHVCSGADGSSNMGVCIECTCCCCCTTCLACC
jgi:hypothetical protein